MIWLSVVWIETRHMKLYILLKSEHGSRRIVRSKVKAFIGLRSLTPVALGSVLSSRTFARSIKFPMSALEAKKGSETRLHEHVSVPLAS